MKTLVRNLLLVGTLATASGICAANIPGVNVTVKKGGKTVYQSTTGADGSFATGNLEPGNYNVEFRAPNLKGQQLSIAVTAGKQPPRQSNADGAHMSSGVAMSLDVQKPGKLTGRISSAGASVATEAVPAGMEKVKANVKVINGKRHVWVPAPIGSNMGGRWVEEGTEGAALNTSNKKGHDGEVLQKIVDQAGNVGRR